MFQGNPLGSGSRADGGPWEHHLRRLDPQRRIAAGAPGVAYRTRLLDHAWVLTPDPDPRGSSDPRGRVLIPAGVAWHLGLRDVAVVSVAGTGIVVVRSAGILDPTGEETATWTA